MALEAWYPLHKDSQDWSGNGNHPSTATLPLTAGGLFGTYADCVSGGTSLSIPMSESLRRVFSGSEASAAFWVHQNDAGGANWGDYIRYLALNDQGTAVQIRFERGQPGTTSNIDWWCSLFRGHAAAESNWTFTNDGGVPSSQWNHIAVTRSGTSVQLWLNGALKVSASLPDTSIAEPTTNLQIGGGSGEPHVWLTDVRFYSHALSPLDIYELSLAKAAHWSNDYTDVSDWGNDMYSVQALPLPITETADVKRGSQCWRQDVATDYRQMEASFPTAIDNLTTCAWVKPTAVITADANIMQGRWYLSVSAAGKLRAYWYNKTTVYQEAPDALPINQWTHVAAVWDKAASTVRLYQNAVMVAEHSVLDVPGDNSTLSRRFMSEQTARGFVGLQDDYRIYSKMLTEYDLKRIMDVPASIDNQGTVRAAEYDEGGYRTTKVDFSNWIDGDTTASIGTEAGGDVTDAWVANSTNRRWTVDGPWGEDVIAWCSTDVDAGNNADGGWVTGSFKIDPRKTYRFTCFVKKYTYNGGAASAPASTHMGTYGLAAGNANVGVIKIADGTRDTNPYMIAPSTTNLGDMQEWCLYEAYVAGSELTDYTGLNTTVRTMDGTIVYNNPCYYKWAPDNILSQFRMYLYYSTDPNVGCYWFQPRVEEVDGTEPTRNQLLRSAQQRNTDITRSVHEDGVAQFTEIDEIGPTVGMMVYVPGGFDKNHGALPISVSPSIGTTFDGQASYTSGLDGTSIDITDPTTGYILRQADTYQMTIHLEFDAGTNTNAFFTNAGWAIRIWYSSDTSRGWYATIYNGDGTLVELKTGDMDIGGRKAMTLVFDGVNTYLYHQGELADSLTVVGGIRSDLDKIRLGRLSSGSTTVYFDTKYYDVRVYNRPLDGTEAGQLAKISSTARIFNDGALRAPHIKE